MGLAYYFRMEDVPRTVTRAEWYKMWRQVRYDRREFKKQAETEHEMFVKAPREIKERMLGHMINPPIVLGPYMSGKLGASWA